MLGISSDDVRRLQIEEKVFSLVAQNELPQLLCKYRSINDYTKDIIKNLSIYFASPIEFNDPFDTLPMIKSIGSDKEIYDLFKRLYPGDSVGKRNREIERYKSLPVDRKLKEVFTWTRVCCFSQNSNTILQWSHYADNHKGICLIFDILEDPSFFFPIHPVKYSLERPHLNYLGSDRVNETLQAIIQKHSDWSYENEIRVFRSPLIAPYFRGDFEKNKLFRFRPRALKSIIFGCRCEEKDRIEMVELCGLNKFLHHVTFKEALISPSKYEIIIQDFVR